MRNHHFRSKGVWLAATGLVLSLALPSLSAARQADGQAAARVDARAALDPLVRRYVDLQTSYDDRYARVFGRLSVQPRPGSLPDVSEAAFLAELEERRALLDEVRRLDSTGWALDDDIDRRVLIGLLEAGIHTAEVQRAWRSDPNIYVPSAEIHRTIQAAAAGDAEKNVDLLIAILKQVPGRLDTGRRNLVDPPRIFLDEATAKIAGTIAMLRDGGLRLAGISAPKQAELGEAAALAVGHLARFRDDLASRFADRSGDSWRLGRAGYDHILRHRWNMDLDAERVGRLGREVFAETERLMLEIARRIDPQAKSWKEVYRRLEADHPAPHELKQAYQTQIDAARAYLIAHEIVSLPEGERVITVDTPPAMRESTPFGIFQSVDPFGDDLTGKLVLTPIDMSAPPEKVEARLRTHPHSWIPIIAVHECYPGHHVDGLNRRANPSYLRKVIREPIMSEGWGLFVEEMMYEEGFLARDDVRLAQLRNRLWRAARVILDVGLHTGGMSPDDAIDFMVEKVGFERRAATLDVTMYMHGPTYPSAYLLGMKEIEKIRSDYLATFGKPKRPKDLYDRILAAGAIPPAYVRETLFAGAPLR